MGQGHTLCWHQTGVTVTTMNTILIVLVLGVVLLAIVAMPKLFGRKDDTDAPHAAKVSAPAMPRSPHLAKVHDIDASPLARWLCDQACTQTGLNLRGDPMALTRIAEAAKKARADIDAGGVAEVSLPYIGADSSGPKHFELRITREQAGALKHGLL